MATVAVVDTNTNPDIIDYPIPGNDDAIGSIKLITSYIADAYLEGRQIFEKKDNKKPEEEKKEPVEEKAKESKKPEKKTKAPAKQKKAAKTKKTK